MKTQNPRPSLVFKFIRTHRIYITAFFFGFLAGPLSAALSALFLYACLQYYKRKRRYSDTYIASFKGMLEVLVPWFLAGLVVMPIAWIIANSFGWNFDPLALVQSKGRHISYKNWREQEDLEAKKRYETLKREWKRSLDAARMRNIENRRALEAEVKIQKEKELREEEEKQIRIEREWKEFNNPDTRREREARYYKFLESIGCLDQYGQIRSTFYCMNVQEPTQ